MLATLLLLSSFVSAGDVPQSFAHLKKVDIGGEATIYVDPSVQCKTVDVTSIQADGDTGYQGPPVYDVCILEIVKGTKVQITFTSGPSDDPYFQFLPIVPKGKSAQASILDVGATTLFIPKGKNVYSEGWCNTMFNERRKFTFDGTRYKEVKQPYNYVGIKTTVQSLGSKKDKTPLVLYSDMKKSMTVATLPVGAEIEVLLHEKPDWYLVRTSFGLVGWVYVPMGLYDTKIGVRFAGD